MPDAGLRPSGGASTPHTDGSEGPYGLPKKGRYAPFRAIVPLSLAHTTWFHGCKEDQNMRVLVVDDDAFVRVLLCLDLPEVELVEATRVQEACAVFARREPLDAIIVDLRLSDGSGLDVVRHARSREWTRNLPIVVLTADADADAAEIYTAGADVYIVKPFVAAEVLAAIAKVRELQ